MLKRLSRLQWQITLAFLTVSFIATLTLEVLALVGLTVYFFLSPKVRTTIARGLSAEIQKHASALEKGDLRELKAWLTEVNVSTEPVPGFNANFTVNDPKTMAVVLNPQGKVVAGIPEGRWRPGEPTVGLTATVPTVRWDGFAIIAHIPISGQSGRQVGTFYYHSAPAKPGEALREIFLQGILPSALVVTACAGLAGGIAGAWVGRRVTRRLNVIAEAADAWAEGDFTRPAPESVDELGQLARRLNRMAHDLQDRMALQQDIAMLEERNRLARDLHDTVKQQVFATALQVSAARDLLQSAPDEARACLDTANELAQQTQKELTNVLQELRPVAPGQGSLPVLLKSHTTDWSRRTGIVAVLDLTGAPALTEAASHALLRLTQEALANVARHSGATQVEIRLYQQEEGQATLTIQDNGHGFSPESLSRRTERGLGLSTMRERAEALPQGSFTLASTSGVGTTITATCATKETAR